jgi:hypothetical protein
MRVEHIAPFDSRFNTTQFYIACAHINVSGPGGGKKTKKETPTAYVGGADEHLGSPGPMVKFPGAYDLWDHCTWSVYLL